MEPANQIGKSGDKSDGQVAISAFEACESSTNTFKKNMGQAYYVQKLQRDSGVQECHTRQLSRLCWSCAKVYPIPYFISSCADGFATDGKHLHHFDRYSLFL